MFKFLKNKLKETVEKFTKKAEEESEELSVDNLTQDELLSLEEEKKEIESVVEPNKEDIIESSDDAGDLVHSVDDLISDVDDEIKSRKSLIVEDESLDDEQDEVLYESNELIVDEVKESDVSSSVEKEVIEVDPLVEEVVQRNKSFEEAEQQASNAPDVDEVNNYNEESDKEEIFANDSNSQNDIAIVDEEIKQEEIVDDQIVDTDVVEDVLPVDTEDVVDIAEEKEEKKGFFKKIFGKKEAKDDFDDDVSLIEDDDSKDDSSDKIAEEIADDLDDVVKEVESEKETMTSSVDRSQSINKEVAHKDLLKEDVDDSTKKKKGFFGKLKERVVKFQLTDDVFEEIFWDFELALLEGNVASEVIEKIKSDLKEKLTSENVSRKEVGDVIFETLKNSLDEILSVPTFDLIEKIKKHRQSVSQNSDSRLPFVICMVGVNGSGKTTTLAKLINLFQKQNLSMVVAAADTFRAAAIQQLEEHTNKLGVKLIKHDYDADPAAVAFDAIKHAQAKDLDLVLIDTAGRLQSNSNLMDELKKLVRVNKPDLTIFIGESITGNDCVEQAVAFNEAVGIDGIILSKADVDEKGGAAISVSYVTRKPILYLGTGQTYDDLKPFDKDEMLETLGL